MFISIVRRNADGTPSEDKEVFQADHYRLRPLHGDAFALEIILGERSQTVDLDRGRDQVFVMNDAGRTVQSYRWNHSIT